MFIDSGTLLRYLEPSIIIFKDIDLLGQLASLFLKILNFLRDLALIKLYLNLFFVYI